MHGKKIFIRRIILLLFLFEIISGCVNRKNEGPVKVLILSGRNNHEWQKTTPVLVRMYRDSRFFTINVTEKPDTLTYNQLKKYDVIVSNWNSWPDNNFHLTKKWEQDFIKYINKGGGALFIHAGASSFYSWKEYHQIGIGRWGKETHHGEQTMGMVREFDQTHPITTGIRDFYITDEIWEKADIYPGSRVLASVSATDEKNSHSIREPALFASNYGKGRSFYTILGHDERALLNTGLETILLRASQWAAHREVAIPLPQELKIQVTSLTDKLSWKQSDTTLSLNNNNNVIWQFNFNDRFGKPYFHPVAVKNSDLTCISPPDHPWHLGLWFSWKFINGVNYWEYLDDFKSEQTGYRSAGVTEIQESEIFKNTDFSADIRMELKYHPQDSNAIMTEKRNMHISPPFSDGSYFIDNEYIFNPLTGDVVLDRTPVPGEPEGQSWGGYSGLSVRFSQDLTSPEIIVPSDSETYKKNNWLYMGFNALNGEKAGICIMQNMKHTPSTTSWYIIKDQKTPFYYFSPAVLYDGKVRLKKGETFQLRYRVWILPGRIRKANLAYKYDQYLNYLSQQKLK